MIDKSVLEHAEGMDPVTCICCRTAESLRGQIDVLCDARERVAMLVPVGESSGPVEVDIARYVGRLESDVRAQRSALHATWDEIGGREDPDEDLHHAVRVALVDLATERNVARRERDSMMTFARSLVERVRRIQSHIEAGGANEELTAATVLCSEILAEDEWGTV